MIVSASYKTDIPAFYPDWLANRLATGWAEVANPISGKPFRVSLDPATVDGAVFWSRNPAPLLALAARPGPLADWLMAVPSIWQITLTGYPRLLEQRAPPIGTVTDAMRRLRQRFGPRAVVWRYDPVVLAEPLLDAGWHTGNFRALARHMAGLTDEVVVSFMQPYAKTRRHLAPLAASGNLVWRDPALSEQAALVRELSGIAHRHGLRLTLCTQPALAETAGLPAAACIDAARLSDVAGHAIPHRIKGNRPGCLCAESRDIGGYDTCPHGCLYCYAVGDHAAARRYRRRHDPTAQSLTPGH